MGIQKTQQLAEILNQQVIEQLSTSAIMKKFYFRNFKVFDNFDNITTQGDVLDTFYIFLKGKAAVWNEDQVVGTINPIEILGLIEYLNGIKYYTGDVVTEGECLVLKIKVEDFISLIQSDGKLCYQVLQVFGHAMSASMTNAEQKHLLVQEDILGYFLFLQAINDHHFECTMTRTQLAKRLNLNLRTLYRYINVLRDNGMLCIKRGKIRVTEDNFVKLKKHYGELIW